MNPNSATLGEVLQRVDLSRTSPAVSFLEIGDWDFNQVDGQLYSLEMQGKPRSTSRILIRIDPATGVVTNVADLSALLPDGQNYGAVYVEKESGIIYVSNNDVNRDHNRSQTFGIQQISPPVITPYQPGPPLDINDGADCLLAIDFGDAPETFHTLNTFGGPGRIITQKSGSAVKPTIGKLVDSDLDGFPSPNADGDDKSIPGSDDEEAVASGAVLDGGTVANPQPFGAAFNSGGEIEDHKIVLTSLPRTGEAWTPVLLLTAGLIVGGAVMLVVARRRA